MLNLTQMLYRVEPPASRVTPGFVRGAASARNKGEGPDDATGIKKGKTRATAERMAANKVKREQLADELVAALHRPMAVKEIAAELGLSGKPKVDMIRRRLEVAVAAERPKIRWTMHKVNGCDCWIYEAVR